MTELSQNSGMTAGSSRADTDTFLFTDMAGSADTRACSFCSAFLFCCSTLSHNGLHFLFAKLGYRLGSMQQLQP